MCVRARSLPARAASRRRTARRVHHEGAYCEVRVHGELHQVQGDPRRLSSDQRPLSLCRERIMEALRSDDGSKELLEKAEAKSLRYLARAVEDDDREAKKRKLNESRLAQAPASSPSPPPGTSSSSTARFPPEERKSEAADGPAVK